MAHCILFIEPAEEETPEEVHDQDSCRVSASKEKNNVIECLYQQKPEHRSPYRDPTNLKSPA